jgi:transposase
MTARQAARELGVSRKTYYEWDARAMQGMLSALQNQPAGRPARCEGLSQQQKRQLLQRIEELEKKLTCAEQTIAVRRALEEYLQEQRDVAADTQRQKKRH